MVKIKDHADYEDTLKELKALEEQTKEMQKVLDEYNSYDDLPDELEDMRNQLIEFLERRKNLAMLNVSILRNSDWKSIDAKIELHVKNLIGQNKKVDKFTIKENGAISNSFISPISNQETLLYSLGGLSSSIPRIS